MTNEMPWIVALLALLGGPYLGYLAARQGHRVTARAAAHTEIEQFYERVIASNQRLSDENDRHEIRIEELAAEVSALNRRAGTYEADLARLGRENSTLREEVERLANLLTQEAIEKRKLADHLRIEQREKTELLKRVVKLEGALAGMAGVITTEIEGEP